MSTPTPTRQLEWCLFNQNKTTYPCLTSLQRIYPLGEDPWLSFSRSNESLLVWQKFTFVNNQNQLLINISWLSNGFSWDPLLNPSVFESQRHNGTLSQTIVCTNPLSSYFVNVHKLLDLQNVFIDLKKTEEKFCYS